MSDFIKITEQNSLYNDIEKMSTTEMLTNINNEDQKVALAVQKQIPIISKLVDVISEKLEKGGRLFYIGAGTSGRLGILDASECPPTFGVDSNMVIGLIAGGDEAIRIAVENAEDDKKQAIKDLEDYKIDQLDVVIGIAASGTTPYVIGGLEDCQNKEIVTACITCNKNSPVSQFSDFSIEVIVGPEFITGSSRMKAGTAQKMVLNMISTSVMIKLGRVKNNKMVDMQLSNQKLIERGSKMISEALNLDLSTSEELLRKHGSVRKAIDNEAH
ncbi:N-acetylmuramic acid 6-phosphate etherase [Psychroflexus halocasei]|uniref:N-acetylmuramic acid 6-phosphate etherase n=1 Tax=Psychroflexus halocasei TaxID=908615 RepID=A0A1H3YLB4_9FLAO|nr:N-acetylmuramic acid 6-phosphate etherase [Psychroflexus halocasei]SEA12197.1 N-acetylmuramic acid 6-phosphate etherase [Psychroflexus halocasei]